MNTPLSSAEVQAAVKVLRGWKVESEALVKTLTFGSFREAISFMVRAAFEAEAMNHHPDWANVYNRVTIRLNTHEAGGRVTAKDVELAKRLDKIDWTAT